jgi:hypothetical protein
MLDQYGLNPGTAMDIQVHETCVAHTCLYLRAGIALATEFHILVEILQIKGNI